MFNLLSDLLSTICIVATIGVIGFLLSLVTGLCGLNVIEFLYLFCTREFFHHLDKRNLVQGDLVFIEFRGSLKKATITGNSKYDNTVQAKFDDPTVCVHAKEYTNYSYSKIFLPKYLSKASRILFAVRKEK